MIKGGSSGLGGGSTIGWVGLRSVGTSVITASIDLGMYRFTPCWGQWISAVYYDLSCSMFTFTLTCNSWRATSSAVTPC